LLMFGFAMLGRDFRVRHSGSNVGVRKRGIEKYRLEMSIQGTAEALRRSSLPSANALIWATLPSTLACWVGRSNEHARDTEELLRNGNVFQSFTQRELQGNDAASVG